ncbi:MAG: LuxR C-terminal-related transcriptional regulator [Mesorhizobium sp.]
MTATAAQLSPDISEPHLASRGGLTAFLMRLAAEIRADSYMLVATVPNRTRSEARIVASNWIFDTIELVGRRLIAALARGPHAAAPGTSARPLRAAEAPALHGVLTGEEAKLLAVLGHAELYSLRLDVGRQRLFILFSAERTGSIDQAGLTRAQLKSCYALSQAPQLLADAAAQDPLSERERECLFWVSEGKTTDEVAVILGVSSNTVNSYITHAMQKLSASNRPMAIAMAVRSGII